MLKMKDLRVVSVSQILRTTLIIGLVGYSVVSTVLLLKLDPKPLVIGIDSYGTRIINSADDRLIRLERQNFVKRFIQSFYSYESSNFESRISLAGDSMTKDLWESRKSEFSAQAEKSKTAEISQRVEISDLREVDSENYQADLVLTIKNRLQETTAKLRLDLQIRPSRRSDVNPYPFEVASYAEALQ